MAEHAQLGGGRGTHGMASRELVALDVSGTLNYMNMCIYMYIHMRVGGEYTNTSIYILIYV